MTFNILPNMWENFANSGHIAHERTNEHTQDNFFNCFCRPPQFPKEIGRRRRRPKTLGIKKEVSRKKVLEEEVEENNDEAFLLGPILQNFLWR